MPTYEFRCPNGHEFEKFYRSISGAPTELACPVCGKIAARQMSAGAGLHFKGSGFYITDYGKDGKKSQTPAATGGDKGETAAGTPPAKSDTASPAQTGEKKASSDAKQAAPTKPGKSSKTSE